MNSINKDSKIYVAGHRGMVGSACLRLLKAKGYKNVIGKTSSELDLRNQLHVKNFFIKEKPDIVIAAAARVGGILANDSFPYDFLIYNLQIQNNLIEASLENNISKFIFLGSSCIYPKLAPQPLKEEYLLSDKLEPTNEWYAIAKISGLKLCQAIKKQFGKNFVSLMPTNLYGPNDNFDLKSSHVLPALIRKFHEAKLNGHNNVILWGSGNPLREFLHVDDLVKAILFSLENNLDHDYYNVGSGQEISIKDLANLIKKITSYNGEIKWDKNKPDGTPRKLIDSTRIMSAGWSPKIKLLSGISSTYNWYLQNKIN